MSTIITQSGFCICPASFNYVFTKLQYEAAISKFSVLWPTSAVRGVWVGTIRGGRSKWANYCPNDDEGQNNTNYDSHNVQSKRDTSFLLRRSYVANGSIILSRQRYHNGWNGTQKWWHPKAHEAHEGHNYGHGQIVVSTGRLYSCCDHNSRLLLHNNNLGAILLDCTSYEILWRCNKLILMN